MPQTSAGQISQGNFTHSIRNFEGVKEAWSIDLLEDSWGPVLIADDIVFVSYAEGFHALKAKTGTKVWTFKTPDPAVVFCASAEHVYLQTLKGTCFCLSILSGRKVWQRDLKASENLYLWMLRFGDTLCVDSVDSTIGINANSGDIKWKIPRTEQHWLCSSVADGAFFIQDDHTLRRFDGTTGSLLSAERLVVPNATLDCVRNGRLYFGQSAIGGLVTLSPVIYSINLGGKSPLWLKRYNFDTKGVHVIDVWRNCVLVLFEMEGAAMFTLDGVEVWRKKVSDKMIYGYVDQDVFYCGYNGGLIAFRCNDGAELAKIQIDDMWPEFISVNKNMIICKSMSTTSANPIPRYKLFSFLK
jgi:outer membrane protein assembly factor BamB